MFESILVEYDKAGCYPRPISVTMNGQKGIKVTNGNSPTGGHGGACKTVFFFDDYVIKFRDMSEAKTFIQEEDRPHFAEVVFADIDRQWYVQRRIDCEPNVMVSYEQVEFAQALGSKYGFGDIGDLDGECYGARGRIGHNFTLDLSGTVVIYDYSG